MKGNRAAWLEINLNNLEYNINSIKKAISPETKIMPVIKADAYGHGAVALAKFMEGLGIDRFVVSVVSEAMELRKVGIEEDILMLNYIEDNYLEEVVKYNLTSAIFTYDKAKKLSEEAVRQNKIAKIHIALDTGMSRIGFQTDEVHRARSVEEILKISKLANIDIEGIFTHFANADIKDKTLTHKQYDNYQKTVAMLEEAGLKIRIKHVSNSASIMDLKDLNLDYVRAGIILYGYYPSDEVIKENLPLKKLMQLKACISNVKDIEAGEGVSYTFSFIADKKTKVATIPIGYADGVRRLLQNKLKVLYKDKLLNNIGNICMDQFMIDATGTDAHVADVVTIIGDGTNKAMTYDDLAKIEGTINYEVLTDMKDRISRKYFYDGEEISSHNYKDI